MGSCVVDTAGEVVHPAPPDEFEQSVIFVCRVACQSDGRSTWLVQPGAVQPQQPLSHSSRRVRPAWSHSMSRFTPSALPSNPEGASSDGNASECWQQSHRLPFNSDSPTWIQERMARPAAEERMTQLVRTLEAEIIPRLVEAHRTLSGGVSVTSRERVSVADVDAFVQLTLCQDDAAARGFVELRRQQGLSIEAIYLDLLTPAARKLGVMWEEDECDFTAVTLGVGRLQLLLQKLSPAFGHDVAYPANARRVLLVPAPGEQHTFGLSMVAEFFLHDGWDVVGGQGALRDEAVSLVQQQWFDVIGFSVGSEARLDWLTSCIKLVREASCNPHIGVLVGGPIFALYPDHVAMVGADATSSDGKQAPITAESLIAKRAQPCR